jgi:small subunit ribosomal protein S10
LPRITQRWTVPKSHFIFKKAQENFERRTYRRLIQIKDGNPETVQLWLAYLRKHQYYGIGMKANMWEFSEPGVGKQMEALNEKVEHLESVFSHLGQVQNIGTQEKAEQLLAARKVDETNGLFEPAMRLRETQSTK